ncbi:MAG: sigma-54 dependent transcriptional regulator [Vicinamibacteria bacterium]|nr:sigma-54 dependent transcriptional regulator [Vicinamibacteria bacterium]
MRRDRVLVVDDDEGVRSGLRRFLNLKGYDAIEAGTAAEAEDAVLRTAPDLVLLDLRLPDGDGGALIPGLRAACPGLAVVVLTGHGSVEVAVAAIKRGAEQFLTKPIDMEALLLVIERVLLDRRNERREQASRGRGGSRSSLGPGLESLAVEAEPIRDSDVPVLILGETGSGKGVLARWLHETGLRSKGPFVDLNCAGISRELLDAELFGHQPGAFTGAVKAKPGLLEVAHGGTVFLDEIGDMDPAIQARLLKVLEEKRFRRLGDVRDRAVDVRLIAATHQDLARLMAEGRFRRDLYFRISAVELRVPPLRERLPDLERLAASLLEAFARETGRPAPALSESVLATLRAYAWPGNVRELRNVLESAALRCRQRTIQAEDLRLRPATRSLATSDEAGPLATLVEVERAHIEKALAASGGHVARTARLLGISTSSLYERLHRFGMAGAMRKEAR